LTHRRKSRRGKIAPSPVERLEDRLFCARIQGIDVSQFQRPGGTGPYVDFTTAYNVGDRFAFIRASRSDTVPDTDASVNIPNAKAAGLLVGVYHRALPFSNTADTGAFRDPIVDANAFLSVASSRIAAGYIRPALDIEDGSNKLTITPQGGYSSLSQWCVAWLNRVETVTGIRPLVYCNTNYAQTYLNSTVVAASAGIWIANWEEVNYGHPVNGSGNPPQGAWGTGSGWDFWQYSSTGSGSTHGAQSTNIDLNVFNGSNIDALKQAWVIGCAGTPSYVSPTNGATGQGPTNILLDWNNTANAVAYDVYVDNMSTPIATNINVSQYTISSTLSTGSHSWKITAKGSATDDDTWITGPTWSFTAAAAQPAPSTPVHVSPANGAVLNSRPVTFTWQAATNATSYDLYVNTVIPSGASNLTSTTWTGLAGGFPQTYTWHVLAKNADASTASSDWTVTVDNAAPSASISTSAPTTGAAFVDFTVTYTDSFAGVNVSTLDSNDITITGPNGYSANATFISVDNNTNGTTRVATYRMAAPGGFWNDSDNGSYTFTQNATQVADVAGNYRAAGTLGTGLNVSTLSFAWLSGNTLNVAFDGSATPIALSTNGGNVRATKAATNLDFASVTSISILGSSADDRLQINAPLTPPITYDNSGGNDLLEILGGTYTFAADIGPSSRNVALYVASSAAAMFDASQHLRSLSIDGTATLTSGGGKLLWITDLQVTGKLNLTNNALAWNYTAGTPIGAWASNVYNGLHGKVVDGRAGGTWTGNGLITTEADASGEHPKMTLAVSEASSALSIPSGQTALFGSEVVDSTTALVKYTLAADADLSGAIDGDDYWSIDTYHNQPPLYEHGDFDLNGRVDADDFWLIDRNYSRQFV
jgi:GH25 family lysozyme M1 (1,4-beta-N-acetylmuramidase)